MIQELDFSSGKFNMKNEEEGFLCNFLLQISQVKHETVKVI